MLKVVGASWVQTAVSLSILVGILVFGILIIVICNYGNEQDDRNFAATVSWNPYSEKLDINLWGQNNDPNEVSQGVARAYYQSSMLDTGWGVLEIETNGQYADRLQAYAAGILEGILSWKYIYWHWKNTVEQACVGREDFCQNFREFLQNNTNAIREKAVENDKTHPFWHQVNLFYRQLEGIEYGWKYEVGRNQETYEIPSLDFLWMNIMSDLKDFERATRSTKNTIRHSPAAMSLLKLISHDEGKFLLAHASSGFYSSMLRIQKKYKLRYHSVSKISNPVPGHTIIFTSYPASIHSQDDFYQILLDDKSFVTVTGTALNVDIPLSEIKGHLEEPVLLGPRVMAANRLARSGKSWTNVFSQQSSGLGNKQWLHVYSKNNEVRFWVLEQTPRLIVSKDETETLHKLGYWISCGLRYYQATKTKYEVPENSTSLRIQKVLASGQQNVSDIQSLMKLMRDPELAIVGRTDLYYNPPPSTEIHVQGYMRTDYLNSVATNAPVNIRYVHLNSNNNSFFVKYSKTWYKVFNLKNVVSLVRPPKKRAFAQATENRRENIRSRKSAAPVNGIIDLKVAQNNGHFLASAGPPFNVENKEKAIEPFQWSKSRIKYLPHNGHSDVWNFQPMAANFVWN